MVRHRLVVGFVSRGAAANDDTIESIRNSFTPVVIYTLVAAGLFALCTMKAALAMQEIDDALSAG